MLAHLLQKYDIFISYSHRDGTIYASRLAADLARLGYSCFFDRLEAPGENSASHVYRALRSARVLVVVASPAARASESVSDEIARFGALRGSSRPLVVIAFESIGAAPWLHQGIPIDIEGRSALVDGRPSDAIIGHIDKSFRYLRQAGRIRRTLIGAAVAALIIAIHLLLTVSILRMESAPDYPVIGTLIGGVVLGIAWERTSQHRRARAIAAVASATESAGDAAFLKPFISYSHKDQHFAKKLARALDNHGVKCFLDVKNLQPGDDIHVAVSQAINRYDRFLLCCSRHSLRSWWVDNELGVAFQKEEKLTNQHGQAMRIVIPLNLDGTLFEETWDSGYKAQLRRRVAADFTRWRNHANFRERVTELVTVLSAGVSDSARRL